MRTQALFSAALGSHRLPAHRDRQGPTGRPLGGSISAFGRATVLVDFLAESGRIDLNVAVKPLLVSLFVTLGAPPADADPQFAGPRGRMAGQGGGCWSAGTIKEVRGLSRGRSQLRAAPRAVPGRRRAVARARPAARAGRARAPLRHGVQRIAAGQRAGGATAHPRRASGVTPEQVNAVLAPRRSPQSRRTRRPCSHRSKDRAR